MSPKDAITYLIAAVTLMGSLLGVGRFVGRIEDRLDQLERKEKYEHGSYDLPKDAR